MSDRNKEYASKGLSYTLGALGLGGLVNSVSQGGGILSGVLGGGNRLSDYDKAKADRGQQAETELNIVTNYMMPMWDKVADIQTAVAVNAANNAGQAKVTELLFDAERRQTLSDFALAEVIGELNLERATCNTIKGKPMLSPSQLGEPYASGTNYLVSRHAIPAEIVEPAAVAAVAATGCTTRRTTSCGGFTNIRYT